MIKLTIRISERLRGPSAMGSEQYRCLPYRKGDYDLFGMRGDTPAFGHGGVRRRRRGEPA